MDGVDDGWSKWLCHITNAKTDDIGFRVHCFEGINLFGDVSEQIVVRQF